MTRTLIIIGAGGFGREVFSIIQAINSVRREWIVEGFVDDGPTSETTRAVAALGSRILGPVGLLQESPHYWSIAAVGSPLARRRLVEQLSTSRVSWATLIHPAATLGVNIGVGAGTVIAPGARLSTNIAVGNHAHVDQNVTVGHDSVLGNFSRLNPLACISGNVTVADDALVGASATILQGLTVGQGAVVGAGAVVVRSVPPRSTVKGVPAS
ncbi:acetyltransferase [Knoellia sp. GCM10027112]|uniref:acetyltransferase n=1 Tax=Knoellia sp. GCM10027112 TaxID=3273395 RepID=UPI00361EB3E6